MPQSFAFIRHPFFAENDRFFRGWALRGGFHQQVFFFRVFRGAVRGVNGIPPSKDIARSQPSSGGQTR